MLGILAKAFMTSTFTDRQMPEAPALRDEWPRPIRHGSAPAGKAANTDQT